MLLFDSAFSPFARKVRMVLEFKGLSVQIKDGLLKTNHDELRAVNGRAEVPTLVDGDTVVVNSSDIVSYLEHRYPAQPIYPDAPHARVHARAWERAADTFIDPILVDISLWKWAERADTIPAGLLEAARADLFLVYDQLEAELAQRDYLSGPLSIADIALFPHIASARALEVAHSPDRHPNITRWFKQMRSLPICMADLERTRAFMANMDREDLEKRKIFWRGDRIEWIVARGFHD
ncbi:MAG: glutathione S-transferase family protein, partial [Betaproteobacteria bacterium]|nr:glutathione S-transferase family protein [Betaproteobacteria bacterium]